MKSKQTFKFPKVLVLKYVQYNLVNTNFRITRTNIYTKQVPTKFVQLKLFWLMRIPEKANKFWPSVGVLMRLYCILIL